MATDLTSSKDTTWLAVRLVHLLAVDSVAKGLLAGHKSVRGHTLVKPSVRLWEKNR